MDKAIGHRPEKQDLVDRNILKGSYLFVYSSVTSETDQKPDDKVAPALQAAKEQLQRAQLEVCGAVSVLNPQTQGYCRIKLITDSKPVRRLTTLSRREFYKVRNELIRITGRQLTDAFAAEEAPPS